MFPTVVFLSCSLHWQKMRCSLPLLPWFFAFLISLSLLFCNDCKWKDTWILEFLLQLPWHVPPDRDALESPHLHLCPGDLSDAFMMPVLLCRPGEWMTGSKSKLESRPTLLAVQLLQAPRCGFTMIFFLYIYLKVTNFATFFGSRSSHNDLIEVNVSGQHMVWLCILTGQVIRVLSRLGGGQFFETFFCAKSRSNKVFKIQVGL